MVQMKAHISYCAHGSGICAVYFTASVLRHNTNLTKNKGTRNPAIENTSLNLSGVYNDCCTPYFSDDEL